MRLLDRQGIFKGDLNTLQRLALLAVIGVERQEIVEMKGNDFKALLIANHPEHADEILKERPEAEEEPLDENYQFNVEDLAAMKSLTDTLMQDIEDHGYAVEEY